MLEDDDGICGYALGTVDVKPFIKKCQLSWIPFMQEKYNKPDCEKDLTEAEVGSSASSPTVRPSSIRHRMIPKCMLSLVSHAADPSTVCPPCRR